MQITIHNPSNLPLIDYRSLKPLQGNLKELKPKNYQKLKNVLIKRGFRVPYFVWREVKGGEVNNWLMDGHGRQKVMIQEDMQPYPVPYVLIEAADLREAKAQLLEITSQYQTVTRKGFEEFTGELDAPDFEDVVFDAFDFQATSEELDEDETPSVSESPAVSRVGEIYQLGRHKLLCGDSTDFGAVSDLMDGRQADMVFTDPPYNVDWDYRGKFKERGLSPIFNDNLDNADWDKFVASFTETMLANMKDGAVYYMCSGYHSLAMFEKHLQAQKAKPRQMIVWAKNQFVMGRQATDYHRQHEQIWYGWKEGASHQWYGGRQQSDLWEIKKVHNLSMVHSTEKPVALPARAIANSSKEGDIVLDLFSGSGSTLMACEQLNRTFYGVELDPKYCDVIRKRYWKFVNEIAEGWEANTPLLNKEAAAAG